MKSFFVIGLTFVLAIILEIIPLPSFLFWIRPEWVILALVYWALVLPDKIGLSAAFLLGLLMDVLMGSLLGQHALAYVVIAYFIIRFGTQIRFFPLWQQTFTIFLVVFTYQSFLFFVRQLLGPEQVTATWLYWLPSFVSSLLWPFIYTFLQSYQNRYRVY